ncbi:CBS domain-containing protein [Faunimonas pinastri]|uniref:CBS domain-containing protein n=1 Tax=Faunimonas pinastri TaxID=1855383 RepID=A0A1H9PWY4_9HYPH|nr:CBS domain-containing protein [Faunimonas pinastri]SER52731.1 CBS domain-containing protein [Faunimonas pinastri]
MAVKARDIMTRNVVAASPRSDLQSIASLFVKHAISAVPICGPNGELLGIVTERDLLRPFQETVQQKRGWWVEKLAEGHDLSGNFLDLTRAEHREASLLMTSPVVTATEDMELPALAELMSEKGVKRLPVLANGHVVGIVSRADLVRAIAGNLAG